MGLLDHFGTILQQSKHFSEMYCSNTYTKNRLRRYQREYFFITYRGGSKKSSVTSLESLIGSNFFVKRSYPKSFGEVSVWVCEKRRLRGFLRLVVEFRESVGERNSSHFFCSPPQFQYFIFKMLASPLLYSVIPCDRQQIKNAET